MEQRNKDIHIFPEIEWNDEEGAFPLPIGIAQGTTPPHLLLLFAQLNTRRREQEDHEQTEEEHDAQVRETNLRSLRAISNPLRRGNEEDNRHNGWGYIEEEDEHNLYNVISTLHPRMINRIEIDMNGFEPDDDSISTQETVPDDGLSIDSF